MVPNKDARAAQKVCRPLPLDQKTAAMSGVQLYRRVVGHVDPDMHVRMAAEVPDEGGPLQPPVVPLAVVADVAVLVKRQAALIQSTLAPQALQRLVLIFLAIG